MPAIHITLQGKGGVGKSVVSALVTQKLLSSGKTVLALDADPINSTFSNYKGLNAMYFPIMEDDNINPRKFDDLVVMADEAKEDAVVIDNGAASFVELASYMKANGTVEGFVLSGHQVFIHTVVTAGQALKDTLLGMQQLVESFGETGAHIILWKNEFWGKIAQDGKNLEEMKIYKDCKSKISAVVTLEEFKHQHKATFGEDFATMLAKKLTFDEAIADPTFTSPARSRLLRIKKMMFTSMADVF